MKGSMRSTAFRNFGLVMAMMGLTSLTGTTQTLKSNNKMDPATISASSKQSLRQGFKGLGGSGYRRYSLGDTSIYPDNQRKRRKINRQMNGRYTRKR